MRHPICNMGTRTRGHAGTRAPRGHHAGTRARGHAGTQRRLRRVDRTRSDKFLSEIHLHLMCMYLLVYVFVYVYAWTCICARPPVCPLVRPAVNRQPGYRKSGPISTNQAQSGIGLIRPNQSQSVLIVPIGTNWAKSGPTCESANQSVSLRPIKLN